MFTVEAFALADNNCARVMLLGPLSAVQKTCPIGASVELSTPTAPWRLLWSPGEPVRWMPGMAAILGAATQVRVMLVDAENVPTYVAMGAMICKVRDNAELAGRSAWVGDTSGLGSARPDLDDPVTVAALRAAQ